MRHGARVAVVIPALNEAEAIGSVLSAIPEWVDDVVVADNGSTDRTAAVARAHGARVVAAARRGYGSACLAGIAALHDPDIVAFLDGDFSDHPEEMPLLVDPIANGQADMVIGSRVLGRCEPGALTPQARFGNWLTCALLRLFWRVRQTDLGPFRAIRFRALRSLGMRDPDYGWTVEMQIRAALRGLRVVEAPVSYRRRIGKSKISGTLRGVVCAGTKILWTVFRAAVGARRSRAEPIRRRLIIFSRYPQPGKAKTRLIPVLGPEGAADLQRRMTEGVTRQAKALAERRPTEIDICFTDGHEDPMREWLGSDLSYRPQCEGDLGRRMTDAFEGAFRSGVDAAIIVGTDVPSLTAEILDGAFEALRRRDLVLGPATDGGYYLIGLRRPVTELFEGVPWSTADVLQRTLDIARSLGLSFTLTPPLADVDRPEDLACVGQAQGNTPDRPARATISIIVPTLNEASHIGRTLERARSGAPAEVIVVDGESTDGTADLARSHGARVIVHPPGRARQMNAGAAEATGDILLFVHADTLLPEGFGEHVRRVLSAPGVAAGAFEFSVDSHPSGMRQIERLANWRSKKLQMPYGDQALFLEASTFHRAGGFPEMPIMEDFEFVRRLRRQGRIATAPAPAVSSARRWVERGVLRTSLLNQVIIVAYLLGVSPERLARWYGGDRASS